MRRILGYLIVLAAWPVAAQDTTAIKVRTDSIRREACRGGTLSPSGLVCSGATDGARVTYLRRHANAIEAAMRARPPVTPPRDTVRPPRDTVRPPPADTTTPPPSLPGVVVLPRAVATIPADLRTRSCTMTAGSDLQSALDAQAATPGRSVLCLAAGTVYRGKFTVAPRADTGWRVIRADVQASAVGVRQRPTTAAGLPRIIGNGGPSEAPITITGSKVALIELEIMTDVLKPSGGPGAVVALGTARETSLAALPQHILLDRLYLHGHPGAHYTRRGVYMGGRDVVIRDSWIDEIHDNGADSQALGGWQGGPLLVENTYLAGASENIMFGGANPSFAGGLITDVTIRGSHIRKPIAWKRVGYAVKNLTELKAARRVLIEGNVFEGSWAEGQVGGGIILVSSSQSSAVCQAWCRVTDVTIRGNIVKDTGIPLGIAASQGSPVQPDSGTSRVLVEGNLFERVNLAPFDGEGRHLNLFSNPANAMEDITLRGNTFTSSGGSVKTCIEFTATPNPAIVRFVWDRNVCDAGTYGPVRSSAAIAGGAFALHTPGALIGPNHYTGAPKTGYPAGTTWGAVIPSGIGVNVSALRARLASVVIAP